MSRPEVLQLLQAFMPFLLVLFVVRIRRTEDGLLNRLRQTGATGPGRAVPIERASRFARVRLRRLLAEGAVREGEPGRYFVDEEATAAYRQRRRKLAVGVIAVALLFAAAILLLLLSLR